MPEDVTLHRLVDFLEPTADPWGTDLRGVMHVPQEDDALIRVLGERGYIGCVVTAQCEITVPKGGFDEYLRSLSRNRRRKACQEIRMFSGSGLTIRWLGAEALKNEELAWRMAELQAKQ